MPRSANLPPMEESPLVSKPSVNNSTIHPEKMEQSRFSELRNLDDEKTNPLRIVVYAVIVIAIGVGAVFLVRNIVSNNQTVDEQQDQTADQNTVEDTSAFSISLTPKSDTTASNLASNEDYVDSSAVTLGDSNLDMTQVELASIRYERYTTFARTTFDFEGNNSTLPKTNISFDSVRRELTVSFEGLATIADELKSQKQINDIVRSIRYSEDENHFVIIFGDDSKYRVFQSSGNLSIDVKTLDELENPDPQEPVAQNDEDTTPPPSTTTPPSSSGNKPAAPYYENSYSQNRQYISSNVNSNSIAFNNYWIWDEGSFFEFSLGINNSSGDNLIPNATSYYEEEDDKIYLVLEIENLSNAPFSVTKTRTIEQLIQDSGASISPAGVNFKMVELVSFTNGKATYKLEVKTKTNYSLLTQVVELSNSQIVSLRIRD